MNNAPEAFNALPMWLAILVTALAIGAAVLTLLGSIGLNTFKTFYERVHAPTLGTTLGAAFVVAANIVLFSVLGGYLTLKPLLIIMFLTVTTPVTLVILGRAAIYRDRVEGNDVPGDEY